MLSPASVLEFVERLYCVPLQSEFLFAEVSGFAFQRRATSSRDLFL